MAASGRHYHRLFVDFFRASLAALCRLSASPAAARARYTARNRAVQVSCAAQYRSRDTTLPSLSRISRILACPLFKNFV